MIPDIRLDPVPQLARVAHVSQVKKANLHVYQDVQAIGSGDRTDLHTLKLLLLNAMTKLWALPLECMQSLHDPGDP